MSHHFDWQPESQDITDCYCFDGASDADGPRTVFGMNVSPTGPNGEAAQPFEDLVTFYELRLDLDGDFVEDITWRFTFPKDSTGTQHVQVAQLSVDSQEMINLISLAMRHGVTATELRDGIYTHPSMTEGLNEVLAALH